ncbi:MAG: pyruvate ferredoxin oxidoreductase [Prevotella sp.]|uniref:hypothetical protein n=1 Tax=Prevotella sp. AGR2160 TaxID=1280674 RepID=UPI000422FAFC|nr:hypothetical protein [Prevotella sp. AGR2160]MDD5860965.1 pyruvate ferredoxin oxidoreductase [Prevotella sp.]
MDYKYINQLMDRYFDGQTTLEEEEILRAFFSQEDVPAEFQPYRSLFAYLAEEPKVDVLGDDFDEKIRAKIQEATPVKARVIPMRQRLMPLFKAAAVVAIFLVLGNAAQMPYKSNDPASDNMPGMEIMKGASTAVNEDSTTIDSLQQSSIGSTTPTNTAIQ